MILDRRVEYKEIDNALVKLKNKKAASNDKIINEMIKASYPLLKKLYKKLFNIILSSDVYPIQWCNGLITPIFKSGCVSDPNNYRGICVSSCLGKFFCSILCSYFRVQSYSNFSNNSEVGITLKLE